MLEEKNTSSHTDAYGHSQNFVGEQRSPNFHEYAISKASKLRDKGLRDLSRPTVSSASKKKVRQNKISSKHSRPQQKNWILCKKKGGNHTYLHQHDAGCARDSLYLHQQTGRRRYDKVT